MYLPRRLFIIIDRPTQENHNIMGGQSQVRPHHKGRRIALFSYNDQKSIKCPLVATTISESQCSHVESPALSNALEASELPYNLQRDIVGIPSSHLGIKNGKLYVTQGRKHICALINFGDLDDITGKHIRGTIEAQKLEDGYGGTLFENNLPIL